MESFDSLQLNPTNSKYAILDLIRRTNVVIQQICVIFLTIAIYLLLLSNTFNVDFAIVAGVLIFIAISPSTALSSILLLNFLAGISPILKTLTKTVSTDSIYYMAGMLYFLNLMLKSYTIRDQKLLKDGFSMNAGYCASVLLASRLNSGKQVFTLLMISVCLLCYLPYKTGTITNPTTQKWLTTGMLSITLLIWLYLNENVTWFVIAVVAFISGFCPILFLYLQRYKRVLAGPWDEPSL
eukprot:NODE_14_length_51535_cov_1.125049.p30 type:complete len:239 gc:universal NODE_14_length_51535_cov_1.125049:27362-26646(-)